jgi:hypothetical protein
MKNKNTNGTVMSSLMAAAIASMVLGILTVLVEASPHFFKIHLNLFNRVGPLSGVSGFAIIAYAFSWLILAAKYGGTDVSEKRWFSGIFTMILLGFLLTFPPFYQLFTVKA